MGVIIGVIRVFCLVCCLPVSCSNVTPECNYALGMANKMITDGQVSANSEDRMANDARLNGSKAWRGQDLNGNEDTWIQVSFVNLMNITAVETQGDPDDKMGRNDWVTKYRVEYSINGVTWSNVDNGHMFTANMDRNSRVRNTFINSVIVWDIRIYPTMKNDDRYGLRFELYGCKVECNDALGMENEMITDDRLSANSENNMAKEARLNGNKAWRGRDQNGYEDTWIQVSFVNLMNITAVATQGDPDDKMGRNDWVTKYRVEYSINGMTWSNVDNGHMFTANMDRNSRVRNTFINPVLLRNIRIYATMKNDDRYGLRFELYGCKVLCDPPCQNDGICESSNTCSCATAWIGTQCETAASSSCDPACENGGLCTSSQTCNCPSDWIGTQCQIEHPCKSYNGLKADPIDCTRFFNCNNNTPDPMQCAAGSYFNPTIDTMRCIHLHNGRCAEPTVYTPASTTISSTSISTNPVYTSASTTISSTSISTNPVYTPVSTTAEENTPASITISTSISSIGVDERRGDPRSNSGAVAGSVIGVLLVIAIIIIVVIWLLKRKRETAKPTPQSGQAFDGPYELTIEGNNGPAKTQPTVVDKPDQEEYAYVDVNKENTPQNEVNPDTGDIYQDVQDKSDEYAYAYADVNASKTADDEPSDNGLVHIYAKSKHGGRPITKDKQNPAADTGDIYQTIQEDPNENEYAYADVKVDANGEPANPQEGWEDNVIYAEGNDDEGIAADKGKEGWVDNNIYATTDNDAQNAEGKSQVEGWEDNIIYGDK